MRPMKPARLFIFGLALGISSQAALAFQEQGGKSADQRPGGAATVTPPPASGLPRAGTEIRIPGLGPVGTLPKFDFGLELLYGAGEQRSVEPPSKSEPSEVQIRGTFKYKFNN
jgi:hypothetical protein